MSASLATPQSCFTCKGTSDARVILPKFDELGYGHNECKRCGLTFDSNVNEILDQSIDRERIQSIDDPAEYEKLFVERWQIGEEDSDDVYTDFDWEDNEGLKAGVARHVTGTIERFKSVGEPKILDLGCGNGFTTIELAKRFGKENLLGVDPSPTVRSLPQKAGIASIQGTLDSLEFPDAEFDVVVIIGNLMLHPDPVFTLTEAFRVLRDGGLIVFDYKNARASVRRLVRLAARVSPSVLGGKSIVQRSFLNMRYGYDRKTMGDALKAIGFEELDSYSKPPRLLEFKNASEFQRGLKGAFWRLTDWVDRMTDERAWVQVAARKPLPGGSSAATL